VSGSSFPSLCATCQERCYAHHMGSLTPPTINLIISAIKYVRVCLRSSRHTNFSYVQTEISTFKWQHFVEGKRGEVVVVMMGCFMCEVAWSAKSYE